MIAILNILFKTKDTLDYLDDKYEDELNTNCNIIFMILGAVTGFGSFLRELHNIKDFAGNGGVIVFFIISIAVGAGFGVLLGSYLLTYIIYSLGRLLKGAGELIDIRVVAAYSMIPAFLKIPVELYLMLSGKFNTVVGVEHWIIIIFYFLIWIWTLKIMTQGVIRFNKFGLMKALLTISPLWIGELGYCIITYIIDC